MERKKLPYGIPNFKKIAEEGYRLVDKTQFVERLESLGEPYIFFLRPRKFGKSLFVSMLEYYYDINHADRFEKLFGDFYIGKHPTSLHNDFLVLMFDFSGINTDTKETTLKGFLDNVKYGIRQFMNNSSELSDADWSNVLEADAPEIAMRNLLGVVNRVTDRKIFLLIDEYDHFANELLAFRIGLFKELVSRTGFVRKFYEVLKTGARDGIIDRMFITGVTPITLDSFTSGFNIGRNLSLDAQFHDMLGFTEDETRSLIELICQDNTAQVDLDEIYNQMSDWYNGHKFCVNGENEKLFNPNMVLYYLSYYQRHHKPPQNLIDINIASDYRKIGNLFNLLEIEEGRKVMENLMEKNELLGNLTVQFNLEREFDRDDLLSLMLYTGFITIERQRGNRYVFTMPNYVIGELYYRYFYELLAKRYSIGVKRYELDDAIEAMAYDGAVDKFVEVVEEFLKKVMSNRDFRGFREGHLKIHILTLLFLNGLYYIQSELEAERGYVDIFLRELPQFPVDYEWVLELKYLPKDSAKEIEQVKNDGMKQLRRYMEKVRPQTHRSLKGVLLIFGGEGECADYATIA